MDRKRLDLLMIFIVSIVGAIGVFSVQHENVHVAIDKNYGNCSTEILYYLDALNTKYSNCTFVSDSDYESFRYLNTLNELAGYNVFGIIMAIMLGSFMIAAAISFDRKGRKPLLNEGVDYERKA